MISLRRHAAQRSVTPAPPRWEKAFGRQAPLEVDLGCGRGDFPFQRATACPGIDLVALEAKQKWITKLRQRAQKAGLPNLRAIRCDVTEDLTVLFGPRTVAGFTIQHPDPWWKKRHRKRRLVTPELAALLARLLVEGGWVFAQTDVPDMAEEMRAAFATCRAFTAIDAAAFREARFGAARSHREARCEKLGIPIQRMAYQLAPAVAAP